MSHTRPPKRDPEPGWFMRVGLAMDRLLNAFMGGDDRETISDRVRNSKGWWARNIWRHFAHDEEERK